MLGVPQDMAQAVQPQSCKPRLANPAGASLRGRKAQFAPAVTRAALGPFRSGTGSQRITAPRALCGRAPSVATVVQTKPVEKRKPNRPRVCCLTVAPVERPARRTACCPCDRRGGIEPLSRRCKRLLGTRLTPGDGLKTVVARSGSTAARELLHARRLAGRHVPARVEA